MLTRLTFPSANTEVVVDEIVSLIGCKSEEVVLASAKTGEGIEGILNAIVERIPSPQGVLDAPLQALIFDSVFNPYRGIETYFKVVNGKISKGNRVKFMSTGKTYGAEEVGTLKLSQVPKQDVLTGDVGYLITGIKEAKDVKVGDTITLAEESGVKAIEGFEEVKPMVFAGIIQLILMIMKT